MAYAKNKNHKSSSSIHTSRTTVKKSRRARSQSFSRKLFTSSKRAILSVIILAALAVILTVLFVNIASPENITKSKLQSIATDYYENFFYDNITDFATTERTLTQVMEPYAEHGFARVTLEQLLLFDDQRHASSTSTLTAYCNPASTYVVFYPTPPYGRTDYHADYTYACTF